MQRTFLVSLLLIALLTSLHAEEISKTVKDQAVGLYGEQAKRVFNSEVKHIKSKAVSRRLQNFCKPYRFFMVGVPVPEEKRTSMTPDVVFYKMASADDAVLVGNAKEISAFLTKLKKPISNEEDVLERVRIFAEIHDAEIRTHIPKRKSIIKKYMDQKQKNWELVISGTESGWKASVTLMTHSDIEYCIRYEFEFSKNGKMSVLSENDIYAYTFYE